MVKQALLTSSIIAWALLMAPDWSFASLSITTLSAPFISRWIFPPASRTNADILFRALVNSIKARRSKVT